MIKEQLVDREGFLSRVLTRRSELGWSEQKVCRLAGLSLSAIKNVRLREDQVPTLKLAVAVAGALRVTPEWLAFGSGDKFPTEDSTVVISIEEAERNGGGEAHRAYSADGALAAGRLGVVYEVDAAAGAGDGSVGEVVTLPGPGISSGHAVTFEWGIPQELMRFYFGAIPGRVIILPVKGDSMLPTLQAGDRVLVDLDDTIPRDGGIFLLDEGFGPIVKRAQLIDDGGETVIEIISDNKALYPYRRSTDKVRVIGRVCGRLSKL